MILWNITEQRPLSVQPAGGIINLFSQKIQKQQVFLNNKHDRCLDAHNHRQTSHTFLLQLHNASFSSRSDHLHVYVHLQNGTFQIDISRDVKLHEVLTFIVLLFIVSSVFQLWMLTLKQFFYSVILV